MSVVAFSNHRHGHGVEESRFLAPSAFIEIAWVLLKQRRQHRAPNKCAGKQIGVGSAVSLAISLRALAVPAIGVVILLETRDHSGDSERDRIDDRPPGPHELLLLLPRTRAGVFISQHIV